MAAAAASSTANTVRSVLHCITALPSRAAPKTLSNHSLIPSNLQTKLPHLKTRNRTPPFAVPVLPICPSLHRRGLVATTAEGYTETDDEEAGGENEEEPAMSSSISSADPKSGRLYVGNLPYSMTSAQLAEIFNQAGTVESVEIVYDRVTDRSRGFAFVTMSTANDANEAIRMFDGSQVGGRTVKVNCPEVPRGGEREVMGPRTRASSRGYVDSPYKVYAGNLGWTVTSDSLKDAFADQPGLLGAKVIYEHGTGRSRGFGFVSFVSPENAQSAIDAMNGKEVGGRPLRLNLASERERSSPDATSSQASAEEASSHLESSFA